MANADETRDAPSAEPPGSGSTVVVSGVNPYRSVLRAGTLDYNTVAENRRSLDCGRAATNGDI